MGKTVKYGIHSRGYRVVVTLPDDLADWLGGYYQDQPRFNQDMSDAARGCTDSGSNRYAEWNEWADFVTLVEAQAAQWRMVDVVNKWQLIAAKYERESREQERRNLEKGIEP